jgi:hypothetical protein
LADSAEKVDRKSGYATIESKSAAMRINVAPYQTSPNGQWCSARDSFSLDARGLDDGPPLLDLGLLESAQRLGSLLLAWRNTLSEIGEPLAHRSPT